MVYRPQMKVKIACYLSYSALAEAAIEIILVYEQASKARLGKQSNSQPLAIVIFKAVGRNDSQETE